MSNNSSSRRDFLKTSAVIGTSLAAPMILTRTALGAGYTNEPTGSTVTFGFNVPQTGAYADEGADELRAYELAVKHINGEGNGNTKASREQAGVVMVYDINAKGIRSFKAARTLTLSLGGRKYTR